MNWTLALLVAAAFAVQSAAVFADDKSVSMPSAADQAKMKKDAADRKAAYAKTTPEEKAAAKKAARAKKQKESDAMIKSTNPDPKGTGQSITKSAADSKAGPAPAAGTMNTPDVEKALKQQKGQ